MTIRYNRKTDIMGGVSRSTTSNVSRYTDQDINFGSKKGHMDVDNAAFIELKRKGFVITNKDKANKCDKCFCIHSYKECN